MITALREALEQAEQLDTSTQEVLARFLRETIAVLIRSEQPQAELVQQARQALEIALDEIAHPVFSDEVEWMRHLGMPEEDIARVMAEPTEAEPGEAYLDANA